jgi:hypothetical protein
MNSLTNGQIKHIIDGAPDGATHYDTHRHGFKYWAIKMDFVTHNLSDLAEILALRERVEKFERELEWIQTKYNTEMRIRQAYQSGSVEVARKAYRQGFMASGEGFNGELYQDGFSRVVSGYNQMESEYIESIKEQL